MKFLRGKVWQILLAVIALVAILCVTASAAEPGTASFKIGSNTYTINQDDENALYFKTNESGVPTALNGEVDEMESIYNIKAVFPKDDGETEGVPTIYLRGAFLAQSIASVSNTETLARIVVEDDANFTVTVPVEDGDDKVVNARLGAALTWTHGNLEICGPGKLYTSSSFSATGAHVTFKDADVEQITTGNAFGAFIGVTFDGGRYVLETPKSFAYFWNDSNAKTVLFTGNTNVSMTTTNSVWWLKETVITVESGYVRLASVGTDTSVDGDGRALRGNNQSFKFKGGTFELSAGRFVSYGDAAPIDLSEYPSYQAVYASVADPTAADLKPFADTQFRQYHNNAYTWRYFKIEPKYTTTVDGGTASPATGVANTEVTLTATPGANQTFSHWSTTNENVIFADASESTTTFTMPAGDVTIKANYIYHAAIKLRGTEYTFSSAAPAYFTTDSEGVETRIPDADLPQDGSEPAYNIKLAFDKTTPVVYLKKAYLKATGTVHAIENSTGAENFAVVTEVTETKIDTTNDLDAKLYIGSNDGRDDRYVDSYIVHDDGSAVRLSLSGGVTFSGDGLLKTVDLTADGRSIDSTNTAKVNFVDANVAVFHASTAWGKDNNFAMYGVGTVTVSGGKVSIYTKYIVYYSDYSHLVVNDGADLSFISSNIVAYEFGNITVNGGRLYVKADGTGSEVFKGANSITVNGGEMEVICGKAVATVGISSLYNGSYAVMGASKATAESYTAGNALSGNYFHIGKKITVTVKDGTAKAYNESAAQISVVSGDEVTFTANAATGDLTFHRWVDTDSGNAIAGMTTATSTFKPTSDMSVTATFAKLAGIKLLGTEYKFLDGEPRYFTTTDGAITEYTGANPENNYHIKLAFDAEGVPTVYLKGATITTTSTKVATTPVANGTNVTHFAIVTQTASTINSANRGIYLDKCDLTFAGSGKLTINGAGSYGSGGAISVQNEAIPAEGTQEVYTITLEADANVLLTAKGEASACIWNEPSSGKASKLIIKGGTLEMIADKYLSYPTCYPDLTGYSGWAAVFGTSQETATAYTSGTGIYNKQQYFKIAPGYTVSVTDGSASGLPSNGGRFFAGQTVTLNATELAGKAFTGWSVKNGPDGFTVNSLANASASTTTFTMPAGNVVVVANNRLQQTVLLRGDTYTILETPAYYTTDANGDIIEATADTYTIKLGYNDEKTATVYLKGANLSYAESVIESGSTKTEFAIETEAPSTLFQTGYGDFGVGDEKFAAVKASGKVTFCGDDLLTMKGYINGIFGVSSAEVLFDDANVVINKILADGESNNGGWYEQAMYGSFKSITFDGGKATLSAPRILCSAGTTIKVSNGADVRINTNTVTSYGGPQFNVVGGSLYIKATTTGVLFHQARGVSVTENGTLEIVTNGQILENAPTLTGDYYAVMGASKETAEEYTAVEGVLPNITGKYFKVGPKATVTVTDGTAKAPYGVPAATTINAIVGDAITLSANAPETSKVFTEWTTTSDIDFANANSSETTFALPSGGATVKANYEVGAIISLNGTPYTFTVNTPGYFTADGTVTKITGDDLNNRYQVKLALVDGVPTVFLKGANISGNVVIAGGLNADDFTIKTEADSQIAFTGNAVSATGDVTFVGGNNLTITSSTASASAISAANVVLGGTNVEITAANGSISANASVSVDTTKYTNALAVSGATKDAATQFTSGTSLADATYFRVAPAYTVTVSNGTAKMLGITGSEIKAFANERVALTSGAAPATNQRFVGWGFVQGSQEPEITNNGFTMPNGDVNVEAIFELFATMKIMGTSYSFAANDPVYFETDNNGVVTKIAAPQDGKTYNIKLALVDGAPTVYLKGATITSTSSSVYPIENGSNVSEFAIVTETASVLSSHGRGIYVNNADLTLAGTGKLNINSNTGGKVTYASGSGIVVAQGYGSTVTFASNADVEIYTHSVVIGQNDKGEDVLAFVGCIWIETGTVPVTIENGAKVQLSSPCRVSYSGATITIAEDYTERVAIYGNDLATAPIFTDTSISTGLFFKIAPGYEVSVENATTTLRRALKGMKVTVTANAPQEGMGLKYWSSNTFTLSEAQKYAESITFTMPGNAVDFTVHYGDLVYVSLRSGLYSTVKGGCPTYYTANGTTITKNGTANNYNIAFECAEDANAMPTLTLNNLTLEGTYERGAIMNGPTMDDLVIRVSGTNTLTQAGGGAAIIFTGNHLVIEGVYDAETKTYGTLNLDATNSVMLRAPSSDYHKNWDPWDSSEEHTATFNNANVNITDKGYGAIRVYNSYDVTINGGTFNLTNKTDNRSTIYYDATGDLTLNDANMTFVKASTAMRVVGVLTINGGNIAIGSAENPVAAAFNVSDLIITDATVEAFVTDSLTNHIPNLDGYNFEYVAVASPSKDAFMADPESWIYNAGDSLSNKKYFRIEPQVVRVQITWGAMSFAYTGAIWNPETLKWEGRWEPTVSGDSAAAGMDGYDPKLASNQINVVNTGTMTVNVSFGFNPDANFGNGYTTVGGAFKATYVTRKPFYFSNWDPVDSSKFPNIWSKAYFWATRDGEKVTVTYGGKTDIPGMAAELKRVFDEYPDNSNMRIMNITAIERRFLAEQTEDCIFMEKGVEALAEWVDAFLREYKRIGGKLDAIHSDLEYIDGFHWYLYSEQYLAHEAKDEAGNTITIPANTDVYLNIIKNPNYLEKVRPQLEERGFKFYTNSDKPDFGELYALHPYPPEHADSIRIWDTVIRNLHCSYLDEAFYKPLIEYYPNAIFSDYQSRDTYGWMKLKSDNAYSTYLGGNTQKVGTHSSYNAYNYAPQWVKKSETNTSYVKPDAYNGAVFEDNAFHMTQWETNNFKSMYAATESKKIEVTLTFYDYTIKTSENRSINPDVTSSGTPYHIEGYLHAGLLDPEFGGYVIRKEIEDENKPETIGDYEERLQVISDIMKTLDAVVGYADRKPIETPLNWNDSFILSGMYANGRNVWRITPDTVSGVSKEDFLVSTEGGQIVFKNKGQTITFPQGSIISEPITFPVGTCGYWVETPADVMPIVTNDADRYEEYPAYVETFDNYTVDEAFSSQYSNTWESDVLGNSSVTIKASTNGSKGNVLAIQGNASLNNVKLPEYITAGDNYAKQQAWELAFKLDALPTGNAEVKLLTASSGANTDGGFCVYNRQLHYSTASGYQAFNITLAANTEYTVKRVFNFRTANSFTCSYYVYGADGSELAKAEDVVISSLSLPVQKIGISTANFDTNTLFVDDYKLYATGVTTDLEVYNANAGTQVDASVAREGNTAYRLSWMNASSDAKFYNVVATYSDSTKEILNSIEMLPGCDGVNTGIVKVAEGKSVTISLEETEAKVPDAGDNAGDDGSSNGSNSVSGETITITLPRFREADVYLYLNGGAVASFPSGTTLGTVTVTIDAITPSQGS